MRRMIASAGMLLCIGCTGGSLLPTPYSMYSDEELMGLLAEEYYEFNYAASVGDSARLDQAMDEFFDVYEEVARRQSFGSDMTAADVRAIRNYYEFASRYVEAAQAQRGKMLGAAPIEESGGDPRLFGTWELVSQNGAAPETGDYVHWTFTPTTITRTSDLNCSEEETYSASGDTLAVLSIVSQAESECSAALDLGEIGDYLIDGDTLTITRTDHTVTPATIVSVFTKAP